MKTLFAKILIWILATIVITATGFMLIDTLSDPASSPRRGSQFFLEEARHIYAQEGQRGLSAYIQRVDNGIARRAILVDSTGHDLESGTDQSDLVRKAKETRLPFIRENASFFFYSTDRDGYWFFLQPLAMSGAWIQRLWLF